MGSSFLSERKRKNMDDKARRLLQISAIFIALIPALLGCATPGTVIVKGEPESVIIHQEGRSYRGELPDIPPGHMPPPGKCRIWYPDRPPGQQPPPGDCRELEYRVPLGA
jgi:hypothetical protein